MMNDQDRPKQSRRAYTGETIVMPRQRRPAVTPQQRQRATQRRIWPKLRLALLVLLTLVVAMLGVSYLQMRALASQVVVRDVRPAAPLASSIAGGVNVLIIGLDARPDFPEEGVRGDSIIVAHLDTAGRWVSLLSIPRDTLVHIPEIGATKMNVAYGYGYADAETRYGPGATPQEAGMALTAQTVEQFLGWPARGQRIDYVAQVDFDGFASIVDAIGGITVDVPKLIVDEAYPNPDFSTRRIEFQPGPQRMDGATALVYARTRHADSDFGRAERQQQVMRAIVAELRQKGLAGQLVALPKLSDGLEGAVATTLPLARVDTLLGLAWLASGLNPDDIGQVQLTPELDPEMVQDGNYNLVWSQGGIRAATDALLTRPSEAAEAARVQVLNGAGITGLAGRVTAQLDADGFKVIPAADAPTADVQQTVVYDVNNKPHTSRRLARFFDAEVRHHAPEGIISAADIIVVLGQDAAE